MTTLRHTTEAERPPREGYLDAAREALLAVGWSRTTLTDIARRAGVSRMTLYRQWSDMGSLLGDLMTREWSGLLRLDAAESDPLRRIAAGVVATVVAIRENDVFRRVVELDPDLLLPYLLQRPGRSQQSLLTLLEREIASGQAAGCIRSGDPDLLARALLLAAHGFVLSAHTVAEDPDRLAGIDAELGRLVERYLA